MTTERAPQQPGELCDCGRPAVTVFPAERMAALGGAARDVPWCGIPDGGGTRPDQPNGSGA